MTIVNRDPDHGRIRIRCSYCGELMWTIETRRYQCPYCASTGVPVEQGTGGDNEVTGKSGNSQTQATPGFSEAFPFRAPVVASTEMKGIKL